MFTPMQTSFNLPLRASLFYCKDILYPQFGSRFIEAVGQAFPSKKWMLPVGSSTEIYVPGLNNDRLVINYTQEYWTRSTDDIYLTSLTSQDESVKLTILFPPKGGVRLHFNNQGYPYFDPGSLKIHCKVSDAEKIEESVVRITMLLAELISPSYGVACSPDQYNVWRLDHRLMGLGWLTYFGKDYVNLIGDKLLSVPHYSSTVLNNGSVLLRLCDKFAESLYPASQQKRQNAMQHIGDHWFKDKQDVNWYPSLENLQIV